MKAALEQPTLPTTVSRRGVLDFRHLFLEMAGCQEEFQARLERGASIRNVFTTTIARPTALFPRSGLLAIRPSGLWTLEKQEDPERRVLEERRRS